MQELEQFQLKMQKCSDAIIDALASLGKSISTSYPPETKVMVRPTPTPEILEELDQLVKLSDQVAEENSRIRKAGAELCSACLHVASNYDGLHRMMLAVAAFCTAMANENGRGESDPPPEPESQPTPDAAVKNLAKASKNVATQCYGFNDGVLKIDHDAIVKLRNTLWEYEVAIAGNSVEEATDTQPEPRQASFDDFRELIKESKAFRRMLGTRIYQTLCSNFIPEGYEDGVLREVMMCIMEDLKDLRESSLNCEATVAATVKERKKHTFDDFKQLLDKDTEFNDVLEKQMFQTLLNRLSPSGHTASQVHELTRCVIRDMANLEKVSTS